MSEDTSTPTIFPSQKFLRCMISSCLAIYAIGVMQKISGASCLRVILLGERRLMELSCLSLSTKLKNGLYFVLVTDTTKDSSV